MLWVILVVVCATAGLSKLECINVNELTGDQAAAVVQGIVSTSLTSLRLAHGKLNTGVIDHAFGWSST